MHNTTIVERDLTAKTRDACIAQRVENITLFIDDRDARRMRTVLELCVGPSFEALAREYSSIGIECWGNDIDPQWKPKDKLLASRWIDGDALQVATHIATNSSTQRTKFDVVVFAPPLSRGCTGRRSDSLMIDDVTPRYADFTEQLNTWFTIAKLVVLVLPGRSRATRDDRRQFHHLMKRIVENFNVVEFDLIDGCTKYVDLYVTKR